MSLTDADIHLQYHLSDFMVQNPLDLKWVSGMRSKCLPWGIVTKKENMEAVKGIHNSVMYKHQQAQRETV